MNKLPIKSLKLFKYGNITIRDNKKKILEITCNGNEKRLNIIDFSCNIPINKTTFNKIIQVRDFADILKNNKITLYIYNKNKIVMKIGFNTKSKLSMLVTKSKNIEIKNIMELHRLDKRIRLK